MKIFASPYFDMEDGIQIMIMDDPSEDSREVYYRIPGYPYVFAYGLPASYSMFDCIHIAKCNASNYVEDLFK